MARESRITTTTMSFFHTKMAEMNPGYYSGPGINPGLGSFVRDKSLPLDEAYRRDPFAVSQTVSKATALYNMHAYWSKKPHDAMRSYIRHFAEPNGIVLDPFCGSGSTIVSALLEGRCAVGIDLSPAATFIASNYVRPVPIDQLRIACQRWVGAIAETEVGQLYSTVCHRTGRTATILRTIYSSQHRCNRCYQVFPLFNCPEHEIPKKSSEGMKTVTICPNCLRKGVIEELTANNDFVDRIPVATEYRVGNGAKIIRRYDDPDPKARMYFEEHDLALIARSRDLPIKYWYPERYMMDVDSSEEVSWGLLWRPYHRGIRKVADFFTKRNLNLVASLLGLVPEATADPQLQQVLRFALTGILPGLTFLNRYRPDVSFPLNYSANTLYVPPVGTEENPIPHLVNKIERIVDAYSQLAEELQTVDCLISTQDACDLGAIPENSIDYVLTDPPYGYRIQFGELNFLWESWLGFDTAWRGSELIVNENATRQLSPEHWTQAFRRAMSECYRVLKPGRWLSLCFHDSSTGMWESVQDVMLEIGFIPDALEHVVAIDTNYHTHKQAVAHQIAKRDLVISYRKPYLYEIKGITVISGEDEANKTTFREKVVSILAEGLESEPGLSRDRLYDLVVSRMVRKGEFERHDFESLLRQVAEPNQEDGDERWFLRDSDAARPDAAESELEDKVALQVRQFMTNWLRQHPENDGVHYSDIFEYYLTSVPHKPRRRLQDWLPDYFYWAAEGTYRPPESSDEERAKAEGRHDGTNRRIKLYLATLSRGSAVPARERPSDATLAEWIRHCKRAGLYEQGRTLYEKGGLNLENLPEEAMVNVEEDYQVCVRMLARSAAAIHRGQEGTSARARRRA